VYPLARDLDGLHAQFPTDFDHLDYSNLVILYIWHQHQCKITPILACDDREVVRLAVEHLRDLVARQTDEDDIS